MPLLDYWRTPEARLAHLWHGLDCQPVGSAALHFEYPVPVMAGHGKASYTDLMVLGDDVAVAIEAKFTEPRYESVGDWLGPSPTRNRSDVLHGWLEAIARVVGRAVAPDAVDALPYQLIHRTASVCCVDRARRFVVCQVFGDTLASHYSADLQQFAFLLAPADRLQFFTMLCPFQPTEAYQQLEERWDVARERDLADAVRAALLAAPLLEFTDPVISRVLPESPQ